MIYKFSKEDRKALREIYKVAMNGILKHYPKTDPYFIDWRNYLTPIELNVWDEIRRFGLPFYPQFPVKGYFIDFADPVKKIGIEVDSKRWHEDKEGDQKRQEDIEKEDWLILRIDGKNTFKEYDELVEITEDGEVIKLPAYYESSYSLGEELAKLYRGKNEIPNH